MQRRIRFSDEDTYYLLLNIIAHDVIHDYGPAGCSEQRWEKNKAFVQQFYSDSYTFRNPLRGGDNDDYPLLKRVKGNTGSYTTTMSKEEDNYSPMDVDTIYPYSNIYGFKSTDEPRRMLKLKPRVSNAIAGIPGMSSDTEASLTSSPMFPGEARRIGISPDNSYEEYSYVLNEMKNMINTTIIYTFFNHFLYLNNNNIIDYKNSNFFIIPYSSVIDIEIFETLCNKFMGHCSLHNFPTNMDYHTYLVELCNYLSSYAVEQSIFENIDFQETGIKRSRGGKKQYGGVKDNLLELNLSELTNLTNQINDLMTSQQTQQKLQELTNYLNIPSNELTQEQINTYSSERNIFLKQFHDILKNYGLTQKAGSIYGDKYNMPIPVLNKNMRTSSRNSNLVKNFPEKIKVLLDDVYEKKNKLIEEEEKLKLQQEKQRLRQQIEEEKLQQQQEKQRLADLEAQLKGELTSQDRDVRENFADFIAKSGLFLTNICDENGLITSNAQNIPENSALRQEIYILLYIANWRSNSQWNKIRSQSLDNILMDFFKENYHHKQIEGMRYVCRSNKYVVNNAANLESALNNLSFCPYSSILDGMSYCSWNTSSGNREFGNMDFKITNVRENFYYRGTLNINNTNNEDLNLGMEVKLPITTLRGNKNFKITGKDLEAHFVLMNTLSNTIDYILSLNDSMRDQVFAEGKIFNNLFNIFKLPSNTNLFNIVFSEILFKGTGDLFQEINCVCKYGGYTMNGYTSDPGVLSYKGTNGNQLRFFAANDRPSGCRFIYMLLKGDKTDLNLNAVGGYYSKELTFLVNHPTLKSICPSRGGRKIKTKKKHKMSKNTFKRNRNSKTYKKYKNNI